MPTDQLDDREMDRMLRELAPPVPDRSAAWERELRADLVDVIEAGVRRRPHRRVAVEAAPRGRRPSPDRRRRWALVGVAAAVVVIGLLVLTPRWTEAPAPADPPLVPSVGEPARWPDVFPALDVADPRAAGAVGLYSQLAEDDPARTSALVGRVAGDDIADGVTLHVVDGFDAAATALVGDGSVTIDGDEYLRFIEPATSVVTVVVPGDVDLLVTGADPVAFLAAGGTNAVVAAGVDDSGIVTFELAELPDGYQVVVPPTPILRGAVNAALRLPGAGTEELLVFVEPTNPLISVTNAGNWRRVDIDGADGWASPGPGNPVSWRVSSTTWSTVWGADSPEAALEIARALAFVDETTWRERYGVTVPAFDDPPPDDAAPEDPAELAPADLAPPDLAPPDLAPPDPAEP